MRSSIICFLVLAVLHHPALHAGETATQLDGKRVPLTITAIADGNAVTADGAKVPLDSLRSITRKLDSKPASPPITVHLRNGSVLPASSAGLEKSNVQFAWHGERVLPTADVSAILFSNDTNAKQLFDKVLGEQIAEDQVIVTTKSGVRLVKGVLLSIGKEQLELQYQGKDRKIGRDKLHGVVLAGKPDGKSYRYRITFASGAVVRTDAISLKDNVLTVDLATGKPVERPWDTVGRIEIMSDKLVFLSDLKPLEEMQTPIVTFSSGWKKDTNLFGKPLTIGKETFDKGIGVHSHSRLVFASEGYKTFAATIGIDAEAAGKGDCVFRISSGDKVLYEKRVKGKDKALPITVDLNGATTITLEVLPGENLDVGDHGDWADARFLK